ncbi:ComEC/Rec2 family competence protein [Soonwooa sp.]|uniref:ComEC/Rec2 family competence protein n=1 Tax=Soonwooa sp. TaxID=1938592 RepID=UPI00261D4BF1|nr:ComEC/Rec2 family competence protein [Soonwooa sp.]
MSRQPLFVTLLAFCLGILLQDRFGFEIWFGLLIFIVFTFVSLFSFIFKIPFLVKFRSLFLVLSFFGFGAFVHWFNVSDYQELNLKGKHNVVFEIDKKLNSNENYRKYQAKISQLDNEPKDFSIVIQVPKTAPELDFKHVYKSNVYFSDLKSPEYPFQFNYPKYLERQKVSGLAFANGTILEASKSRISIADHIKQKRLEVLQRINHSQLNAKNREFLKGIILADRTEMDEVTVLDFNKSGLVHLLAISGSHMVIIFWLILFISKKIFPNQWKKVAICFALLGIWCFAIFIDYGSSVVRSCLMISFYYVVKLLNRPPSILQSLSLSAFVILLCDSQQFFDVGFQLSYVAVLGIFWLNQPIIKCFPKRNNKFYKFVIAIFSLSLSAQLATLPLVLYYFHQFSLVSILANLCIIPFSEIIIIFSLLMVVSFACNLEFVWLDFVYDYFVFWLLKAIHWFADFEILFTKNIGFSILEILASFVILYWLRYVLVKRNLKYFVKIGFSLLVFFMIRLGINFYHINKDEVLEIASRKNKIIIIKEKSNVYVLSKNNTDNQLSEKYLIGPYLAYRRLSNYQIINVSAEYSGFNYRGKYYDLSK